MTFLTLKRHRNVIPFCGHEIFSRGAEIFFWEAEFFKKLVVFFYWTMLMTFPMTFRN